MQANVNHVRMNANLIERTALRFTPAGIPVVEAQLQHLSETVEAGMPRRLDFSLGAIAIGDTAVRLAAESLGSELELSGFLAPRTRRSTRLLVHVVDYSRRNGTPADGASGGTTNN